MPTNYTPVPSNAPATITLPSDLDDADAESVDLAFRALSDNLMGLAAIKGNANTFTGANTFNGTTAFNDAITLENITATLNEQKFTDNDSDAAVLWFQKDAGDDSHFGNIWKHIAQAEIKGTTASFHLYSGDAASTGQFILVYNAGWSPGAQHWTANDTSKVSLALQFEGTGVRVAKRASGPGTWTSWTSFAAGDLTAGGNITAGGSGSFGNVQSGGSFNFSSPPTTDFPISIFDAIGADNGSGAGFVLDYDVSGVAYLKGSGASKTIEVPFKLPVGGTFSKAAIMADVTGDLVAFAVKSGGADWSGPGLPSETILGGTMGILGGGGGLHVYDTGAFSETVTRDAEYRFAFHASSTAKIYGFRVTCTEPGPRN